MERVVVGRGSKHKIKCQVEQPRSLLRYIAVLQEYVILTIIQCQSGMLLRWEFVTSYHDISFGVYHKQDGGNKEDVVYS